MDVDSKDLMLLLRAWVSLQSAVYSLVTKNNLLYAKQYLNTQEFAYLIGSVEDVSFLSSIQGNVRSH